MKLQLNEKWNVFDVFCLLESIARDVSLDAELTTYDELRDVAEKVSVGLDTDMYAAAYLIYSEMDIKVAYPDGKFVFYTHWLPGEMEVEGNDSFIRSVEAELASFAPVKLVGRSPLSFARTKKLLSLSVNERLRLLHRAAASNGAAMYLTDVHRNGKLIRITATWMLDVYEEPLDVVIRFPNGGWFIFHNATGVSYASGERFSEAQGLLKILE